MRTILMMKFDVDSSLIADTIMTVTETKRGTSPHVIQSVATVGGVRISVKQYIPPNAESHPCSPAALS